MFSARRVAMWSSAVISVCSTDGTISVGAGEDSGWDADGPRLMLAVVLMGLRVKGDCFDAGI
jgi:hypothetical protein